MEPHSGGPIGAAIAILGDRWCLVILRDVIFSDRRHFRALLTNSPERIASNILADRLVRLVDAGLLTRGTAARGQRARYSLTEAGIHTVPVLLALGSWGRDWGRDSESESPEQQAVLEGNRDHVREFIRELRSRHLTDGSPADRSPADGEVPEASGDE